MGGKIKRLPLFQIKLGKEFVNSSFLESLTQKISRNRRDFLDDYGVEIPKVNIIDSVELGEWEYEIRVSGVPVQRFSCKEGCFLSFDFGDVTRKMKGEPTKDPSFGMEAMWIPDAEIGAAKNNGYHVYPHDIIVITNLVEVIRKNMKAIITSQYVEELLTEVEEENATLVRRIRSKYEYNALFIIQGVLASLLEECVSIRNIVSILEVISDATDKDSIATMTEHARQILGPAIVSNICHNGELNVIRISEDTMEYILAYCSDEKCNREFRDDFIFKSNRAAGAVRAKDRMPVLLVPDEIRKAVWTVVNPHLPGIMVLSLSEVQAAIDTLPSLKLNFLTKISVENSARTWSINTSPRDAVPPA